jgi:hypothetical protein
MMASVVSRPTVKLEKVPSRRHKTYIPITQISSLTYLFFFLNLYIGGWNLKSTPHCGHQWPIVPAPGDYDDGEIGGMIGR